jgi:FemAB-related protein (PEP-CTERM system-associated)
VEWRKSDGIALALSDNVQPCASFATDSAPAATPQCRPLEPGDAAAWDRFVEQHERGSLFHLLAWKQTVEESFGYKPFYVVAFEGGRISGVLPLFLVKNPIVGRALISSPFAVYGGVLASSPESFRALHSHAVETGREMNVDYIEFRNAWPEQCAGEPNVHRYVTFTQPLENVDDEELLRRLPKKTRNMIRKALRSPFITRHDVRDVAVMHDVHSRNMRRLGTPNFPPRYFRNLLRNFGPMADVREVILEGRPMAVSMNLYFNKEMHTYHAAADARFSALAPNMYMYFDHLRWASQNGYHTFDFGRSKRGTGAFEFKTHWNTTMRPLPYEIVLVRRKELPNFSPANPKFEMMTKVWQRLPLPLARALSPFISPLFP